jgi:protein involved in sex pheromone biosynthesis
MGNYIEELLKQEEITDDEFKTFKENFQDFKNQIEEYINVLRGIRGFAARVA